MLKLGQTLDVSQKEQHIYANMYIFKELCVLFDAHKYTVDLLYSDHAALFGPKMDYNRSINYCYHCLLTVSQR